jgi:hypothetical protein
MKENTSDNIVNTNKLSSIKSLKGIISKRMVAENLWFFAFVAFLIILYIANGHQADKMLREMSKVSGELKELQFEYKTVKSELMSRSREAQVIRQVSGQGLKIGTIPPMRIQYLEKNKKLYND